MPALGLLLAILLCAVWAAFAPAGAQPAPVPSILPAERAAPQVTPPPPPPARSPDTGVPAIRAPGTAAPAAAPAPPAADLERLLRTLENDTERAALVETIRTLIQVQRPAEPESASPVPDRVAGRFIETMSREIGGVGAAILGAAAFIADAPKLGQWIAETLSNPITRERILEAIQSLGLILLGAIPALFGVRRALRPARLRIEERAADAQGWRLALCGVYHLLVALIPTAVYGLVAFAILAIRQPSFVVALVAGSMINAALAAQAVGLFSWVVLAPKVRRLRLVPIDDESAIHLHVWVKRITNLAVYGAFLVSAAYIVGMAYSGYVFLMKLLGVVVALMLAILILQHRHQVAAFFAGGEPESDAPPTWRRRLAEAWHLIALAYVLVVQGIWLLEPEQALVTIARATVVTLVAGALAWGAVRLTHLLIRRAFALPREFRARFPDLEGRVNRYSKTFDFLAAAAIWIFAALVALSAWGLDSFAWLLSPAGRRTTSSMVSIGLTLVVAVAIWEAARFAFERYLGGTMRRSAEEQRRIARVRTLVPLLNRLILGVLAVLVALVTLSELGINIAPLLAVSGAVGIAIGLGAQQFIRDVIAGISIVVEDSFAVGDVVQVGSHSGVVESMSLRTLRLRGVDGAVHTIPYGEFHTVSNMTKDFSFAVVEAQAAHDNDLDRVIEVFRAAAAELRADPDIGPLIREQFEFFGVERVTDSAFVCRGRFKVLPGRQWRVVRAFNRILKLAFDREDIRRPPLLIPDRTG